MVERTAARRRRRRARSQAEADGRATTSARAGRRPRRPGRRCSRPARCSAPRTSACSRASAPRRVRVYPRPRVGVLSTGDELVESRRRSRRARSATRTGRCCSALVARGGRRAGRPRHRARRRGPRSSRCSRTRSTRCDAVLTSGGVSVGDYDYVKAALDRLRRARVVPGRDQAGEAARVRRRARRARVRAAGQPGVVARELRAVRPARAAARWRARRRAFRPEVVATRGARVHAVGPTASCTSTACACAWRRRRLRRRRAPATRRATCSRRPRPRTGSRCSPTVTASPPATTVAVMLLDAPAITSVDSRRAAGVRGVPGRVAQRAGTACAASVPARPKKAGTASAGQRPVSRRDSPVRHRSVAAGDAGRRPPTTCRRRRWSTTPRLADDDPVGRACVARRAPRRVARADGERRGGSMPRWPRASADAADAGDGDSVRCRRASHALPLVSGTTEQPAPNACMQWRWGRFRLAPRRP